MKAPPNPPQSYSAGLGRIGLVHRDYCARRVRWREEAAWNPPSVRDESPRRLPASAAAGERNFHISKTLPLKSGNFLARRENIFPPLRRCRTSLVRSPDQVCSKGSGDQAVRRDDSRKQPKED